MMDMTYDRDADAAYIRFSEDKVMESEEVSEGVVPDYNADGRIVGMEVLDASRHPFNNNIINTLLLHEIRR